MHRARDSQGAERLATAKAPRKPALVLALVFVSTAVLMTVYELAKSLAFPSITLWGSHLITICMSSAAATLAAFYVLRRLRHNEESYRRIVEMSPDAIWIHRRGTIILANQACAALFRASSPQDFIGKHVLEFVHRRDHDAVRVRIQNHASESNPVRHYERKYVRWDGKDLDVEVVVCSILYQGEAASLVMFYDIHEQKQAEHKLRESEAMLAASQRIGHMGSWAMELVHVDELDKNPVSWSDEIYRIFGYEVGQIEAARANFLRCVHPDDRERIRDEMTRALAERRNYSLEYRIVRPSGEERHIRGFCDLVLDEKSKTPLRFVGTVHDVTDQKRTEERLARLAMIVECSDDAIASVEPEGTIAIWNKGAERIYGYSESEAVGQPITILSPPERSDEIPKFHEALLHGERIPAFETVRIRKGGQRIDVSVTVSPVRDASGKVIGTASVARDISARKREEERSRRLAQLVDSATEMISTADTDGRITFMNQAFVRAIGWSEQEVAGKYFRDLVLSPNNPPDLGRRVEAAIAEKGGWKGECLYRRKDGSEFPVYLSVGVLKDKSGHIIGRVGIVRDLTESKRAEERFYKAFHLNPEPITIATVSEGRYVDVNDAFLRITGYRREEVIGRTSLDLNFWQRPEDRARLLYALGEQGSVRDLEITFRTKSGEQRVALDSADIIDVEGQKCIIAILKDITERKGLEKQLRQLQKMEAVGQLSGGIAHDFNNLLGVILGYCELLDEGLTKNPKLRKTAQEVKKAGERAASLTRQLLAFSRQQVLEPKILSLNGVVTDTGKMLRRLIGEHIEIVTRLAPDLGKVKADQGQIEQVIMNLAVNARDAMPNGGTLIIETRNVELDEDYALHHPPSAPGKYVELVMTDTGTGMDAQTQSHIFEPFFTTKELGKGTGLGLATVYGVVKQSGGYVWVYSELGVGTTFKVYLPRVAEKDLKTGPEDSSKAPGRGSETILLVEDEDALRTLTRAMLEQNGYKVLEAAGGVQAVELAQLHDGPIDLLLTDIVMPGMNGHSVARNLALVRPGIKVVYMSGYSGFGQRGANESGDILLSKPITRDALLRKLHEVLCLQKKPVS